MIPTYCVAHREPLIAAHLYDAIVHTPPRHDYAALASVVAHPVIARLAPATGPVTVCGYRKIVTARHDKSHEVIPTALCQEVRREDTEPRPGMDFLLCAHDFYKIGKKHRNLKDQWRACHHEQDLKDCLGLAVEMGAMTAGERAELEAEPALIEGGCSMGVYPGDFLRRTLATVVPLYAEFARLHRARFMAYSPAQRRCVAFLGERVETHFILKELRARYGSPPEELFGCLTSSWDGPWKQGTM